MSVVVYYSNVCEKSRNLLNQIQPFLSMFGDKVHFLCIDRRTKGTDGRVVVHLETGAQILLPPEITRVPAMLNLQTKKIIFGDPIFNELQTLAKQGPRVPPPGPTIQQSVQRQSQYPSPSTSFPPSHPSHPQQPPPFQAPGYTLPSASASVASARFGQGPTQGQVPTPTMGESMYEAFQLRPTRKMASMTSHSSLEDEGGAGGPMGEDYASAFWIPHYQPGVHKENVRLKDGDVVNTTYTPF